MRLVEEDEEQLMGGQEEEKWVEGEVMRVRVEVVDCHGHPREVNVEGFDLLSQRETAWVYPSSLWSCVQMAWAESEGEFVFVECP